MVVQLDYINTFLQLSGVPWTWQDHSYFSIKLHLPKSEELGSFVTEIKVSSLREHSDGLLYNCRREFVLVAQNFYYTLCGDCLLHRSDFLELFLT